MDSESWAAELSPAADASRNVPAAERATGNVLAAGRVCATVTLPLESRSERTKQLLTTATPTPDTVSSTVTPTMQEQKKKMRRLTLRITQGLYGVNI